MLTSGRLIMSDELDRSIKQAMEILSQPEKLKGMLELLGGSMGNQGSGQTQDEASPIKQGGASSNKQGETPPNKQGETSSNKNENYTPAGDIEKNMEFLSRAQDVMRAFNTNDPRVNLLTAVTPFLNKNRQKRVNECVQFIRVSRLLPLLFGNNDIFKM